VVCVCGVCVFVCVACVVCVSHKKNFSPNSVKRKVFVKDQPCVYCEVGSKPLYFMWLNFVHSRIGTPLRVTIYI